MLENIFRKEAVEGKKNNVSGVLILYRGGMLSLYFYTLTLIFVAFVAFLFLFKVDQNSTFSGVTFSDENIIDLGLPSGLAIKEVLVADGEYVAAGQDIFSYFSTALIGKPTQSAEGSSLEFKSRLNFFRAPTDGYIYRVLRPYEKVEASDFTKYFELRPVGHQLRVALYVPVDELVRFGGDFGVRVEVYDKYPAEKGRLIGVVKGRYIEAAGSGERMAELSSDGIAVRKVLIKLDEQYLFSSEYKVRLKEGLGARVSLGNSRVSIFKWFLGPVVTN